MAFVKLSEKDLKKLEKKRSRKACFVVVEQIENAGVVVDLTKFSNNITGFIEAIKHYQEMIPEDVKPDEDVKPEDFENDPISEEAEEVITESSEVVVVDATESESDYEELDEEEIPFEDDDEDEDEDPTGGELVEEKDDYEPEPIIQPVVKPKYQKPEGLADWTEISTEKPEGFVRQLYLRYLHREPDSGGFSTYVNYLKSGMPRQQLVNAIKVSEEYRALQAKMR